MCTRNTPEIEDVTLGVDKFGESVWMVGIAPSLFTRRDRVASQPVPNIPLSRPSLHNVSHAPIGPWGP
jgi:hypothetical protein